MYNNQDLNQVTWELRSMSGAPQFEPSQHLPDVPYAAFARSLGLHGIRVESADGVRSAWEEALAGDRPTVLEFVTDPAVPPIPPSASWAQMQSTASAIMHGDSDRADVVKKGVKQKIQEVFPGSND